MDAVATIPRDVVDGLTDEQLARLEHHVEISRRVFPGLVSPSMAKGVQKYGPEPTPVDLEDNASVGVNRIVRQWLPHRFSEAVNLSNQTGFLADALGVDVVPMDVSEANRDHLRQPRMWQTV